MEALISQYAATIGEFATMVRKAVLYQRYHHHSATNVASLVVQTSAIARVLHLLILNNGIHIDRGVDSTFSAAMRSWLVEQQVEGVLLDECHAVLLLFCYRGKEEQPDVPFELIAKRLRAEVEGGEHVLCFHERYAQACDTITTSDPQVDDAAFVGVVIANIAAIVHDFLLWHDPSSGRASLPLLTAFSVRDKKRTKSIRGSHVFEGVMFIFALEIAPTARDGRVCVWICAFGFDPHIDVLRAHATMQSLMVRVVAHAISTVLGSLMNGYMLEHDCVLHAHCNLEPYAYFNDADGGDESATLVLGYRAKGVHTDPATLLYSDGHGALVAEDGTVVLSRGEVEELVTPAPAHDSVEAAKEDLGAPRPPDADPILRHLLSMLTGVSMRTSTTHHQYLITTLNNQLTIVDMLKAPDGQAVLERMRAMEGRALTCADMRVLFRPLLTRNGVPDDFVDRFLNTVESMCSRASSSQARAHRLAALMDGTDQIHSFLALDRQNDRLLATRKKKKKNDAFLDKLASNLTSMIYLRLNGGLQQTVMMGHQELATPRGASCVFTLQLAATPSALDVHIVLFGFDPRASADDYTTLKLMMVTAVVAFMTTLRETPHVHENDWRIAAVFDADTSYFEKGVTLLAMRLRDGTIAYADDAVARLADQPRQAYEADRVAAELIEQEAAAEKKKPAKKKPAKKKPAKKPKPLVEKNMAADAPSPTNPAVDTVLAPPTVDTVLASPTELLACALFRKNRHGARLVYKRACLLRNFFPVDEVMCLARIDRELLELLAACGADTSSHRFGSQSVRVRVRSVPLGVKLEVYDDQRIDVTGKPKRCLLEAMCFAIAQP